MALAGSIYLTALLMVHLLVPHLEQPRLETAG